MSLFRLITPFISIGVTRNLLIIKKSELNLCWKLLGWQATSSWATANVGHVLKQVCKFGKNAFFCFAKYSKRAPWRFVVRGCLEWVGGEGAKEGNWKEKEKLQQFLKVVPLEFIQSLKLGYHVLFQRDTLWDFLCVSQIVKWLPLFHRKQSVQKSTWEGMPWC